MSEELKKTYEENQTKQVVQAKMPKGLVVTGIVAVVGSWFGMAVYMNHRISDLESGLTNGNSKVISSIDDKYKGLSSELNGIEVRISNNVQETSSVLAKGLLDLTENGEKRHDALTSAIQTSQKQLESAFTQSQEKQIETVSNILTAMGEAQSSNSQQVIQSIKDTKQSLQGIVQNGLQNQNDKLSALANSIEQIPANEKEKSKIIHAQLTALSNRIQEFRNELSDSQESINKLNNALPQWKDSTKENYTELKKTLASYEDKFVNQMKTVQEKIVHIQHNMEQSTENLLKTLYLTSEGLEGTKFELKSEVETMKQSAKQDFDQLNKSIHSITNSLKEIKSDLSEKAVDTTSLQSGEINDVIDSVQAFSDRSLTIHTTLQSHIDEIKAWLDKDSGTPLDRTFFKKMVEDYQGYLDNNNKQIANLMNSILEIHKSILEEGETGETVEQSKTTPEPVDEEQKTAMHPEERTESEVGVSLY